MTSTPSSSTASLKPPHSSSTAVSPDPSRRSGSGRVQGASDTRIKTPGIVEVTGGDFGSLPADIAGTALCFASSRAEILKQAGAVAPQVCSWNLIERCAFCPGFLALKLLLWDARKVCNALFFSTGTIFIFRVKSHPVPRLEARPPVVFIRCNFITSTPQLKESEK